MSASSSSTIIETSLILCECISEWQAETMETGNGSLDWNEISEKMSLRTGKAISKMDLQTVWKYIAYGKHNQNRSEDIDSETFSDNEDPFYQPLSAIKRHSLYLAQKATDKLPLAQRNYLPPGIHPNLNAHLLGGNIKVRLILRSIISYPRALSFFFVTN